MFAAMCGIAGSTHDPEGRAVREMLATLVHRGPDDEGVHLDGASGVTIGARRLSIVAWRLQSERTHRRFCSILECNYWKSPARNEGRNG